MSQQFYKDKLVTGSTIPAAHNQNTNTVIIPGGIGTPTYDDMQDWLRMNRSAGRLTGGTISAYLVPPTADGKLSITALEGMIFTTNVLGGDYIYFKQAAGSIDFTGNDHLGVAFADNKVFWVYFDWNAGTPRYCATTNRALINEYNNFTLGRVWRSGTLVETLLTGHNLYNKDRRSHNRLILKYGAMDHVSGAALSALGALGIQTNAGSWYAANKDYTTPAVTTFFVWYRHAVGAWAKTAVLSLFSEVITGGHTVYETYQIATLGAEDLAALTANKYGVFWVFLCPEGHLYVVLGTNKYDNIGAAQAATVPSSLPPYCVDWASLIGRVICKNANATFYSVESSFVTQFTLSAAVDHSSLADLSTDDHTQYILATGTRAFSGNQAVGGNKFTGLAAGSIAGDSVRFEQLFAIAAVLGTL